MTTEVSLPAAAARLGVAWSVANRLMLSGELGHAEQKSNGRWFVTDQGIREYLERAKPATK